MRNLLLKLLIASVPIALVLMGAATAQVTFEETFGGRQSDQGYSVQQTRDGGYIITGRTESFHLISEDVYLIKTDSSGSRLWTQTYGGDSSDCGRSVEQTLDHGYIIAGYTRSIGAGLADIYLIKTDSLGHMLWEKSYGGAGDDNAFCVLQTSDTGYVIAGQTTSFGAGDPDVYLIKTDSLGDTLWTRTYGGSNTDLASSVVQTHDEGYAVVGATGWTLTDSMEVYVIKTDSIGELVWETTVGGAGSDYAHSVHQTHAGGYIITGQTPSQSVGLDILLIKMDTLGDTVWTRTHGGPMNDIGQCVRETSDGCYVIAGMTSVSSLRGPDLHLLKTDSLGEHIWTRVFGGYGSDWGYSVQQTADGGYVVAGYTESFGAGRADVYLIKTDAYGLTGIQADSTWHSTGSTPAARMRSRPDPFREFSTITFSLERPSQLTLEVFDASGRLVRTLLDQNQISGSLSPVSVRWDGTDDTGRRLSTGIYFYRLTTDDFTETGRATLIR